ncbi:hypothetical protein [Flavihumibacter profundi]|uniref:hypothetical protein n=1 Tax=Flavihumibacter profundi TaxID=2716883 RepID=UPI001CC40ED3|nr:hypothetical protein [Flavihumibacter profundi]MBZ5856865.1 hypothetical protein [Flavihumibacter profundi]
MKASKILTGCTVKALCITMNSYSHEFRRHDPANTNYIHPEGRCPHGDAKHFYSLLQYAAAY